MNKKNKQKKVKIEKFLSLAIKIGLGICLLTPFVISPSTYFPFVVGKAISFQIIVEILLILYLFLILISPRYRPRMNFFTWLIITYFIIITISSLFGFDRYFSFWSNYERMDGVFNLYHFGAFFFILTNVLKKRREWLFLFRAMLCTFVLIDFLGLLQKMNVGYLAQFSGDRAFSTLGNATYLGVMGVFQIFFALFLFLADRKLLWRILYLLNGILGIMAIFISQSRGALLAVFISGVVFLTLSSLFSDRRKIYLSIFSLISVVLVLAAFIFSHPDWAITKVIPSRLNFFAHNLSLETRGYVWKSSWQAWKEKPLLGWGRSSSAYIFPRYYDPATASYEDVWFDKPHSKFFEVAEDTGFLGVFTYLSIIGAAVYILWRKRKAMSESSLALISFIIAYLIQNIFLFDTQSSYLWWYSTLGFIGFLSLQDTKKQRKPLKTKKIHYLILSIVLVPLICMGFFYGNFRPLLAAKTGITGLMAEYQLQDAGVVLPIYESAINLNTFGTKEILSEMTKPMQLIHENVGGEKFLPFLDFALEKEEKIQQEQSWDLKNALVLGKLYHIKSYYDQSFNSKIEKLYGDFITEAPNQFRPYFELIMHNLKKQDFNKMSEYIGKTINMNPNYYRPYWRGAETHFLIGQKDIGRRLLARGMQTRFPWNFLINQDYFLDDEDRLWFIDLLERVVKVEDNWDKPHLILGALYFKIDDEKSYNHFQTALNIDPDKNREGIEKYTKFNF